MNTEVYEDIDASALAGNEIIVVHAKSEDARRHGHSIVGGGSILEVGLGSHQIMGRRADIIYVAKDAFWTMVTPGVDVETERANFWLRNFLLCRLLPKGRLVVV